MGRITGIDKLASNSVHETPRDRRNDEMAIPKINNSEFVQRKSVNELQLNAPSGLNTATEEGGYTGETLPKDCKVNI